MIQITYYNLDLNIEQVTNHFLSLFLFTMRSGKKMIFNIQKALEFMENFIQKK